ncbi:MAG: MjaI family restriction endonuclease [Desulfosalsimonadaceae bacterium]|nr:MjaI family restriction endonuclease [Desulfosalsimonadaceae bacterium]
MMRSRPTLLIFWILTAGLLMQDAVIAEDRTPGSGPYFTIPISRIMEDAVGKKEPFPKYTTQLINLANQNSQATRPKNIGQMSELIQAFPGESYDGWMRWYVAQHPGAIDQATDKTYAMIEKMRQAMAEIDKAMVRRWVEELVLAKTYAGLKFQESILKDIAGKKGTTWRLAKPEEESKGIDGYIGDHPVSIKPVTYKTMKALPEVIEAEIIYYEKVQGGIRVYDTFK